MKRFARGALTLAFWLAVWAALALLVLAFVAAGLTLRQRAQRAQ